MKLHTLVTKGAASRKAALMMAFKLMDAASARWRAISGRGLVRSVLDGATYTDGVDATMLPENDETEDVAAA